MKFGPVEGTPEEVRNFYQDNGFDLSDYIEKPDKQLHRIWLIIPAVCFVICFGALSLFSEFSSGLRTFIFLSGCACVIWISVSTHTRFKSPWPVLGAVILIGLLIMTVALGAVAPSELFEYYKTSQSK